MKLSTLKLILAIAVIIWAGLVSIRINHISYRLEDTRQWIENVQYCLVCTNVSTPCVKCLNTVYNVSMLGGDWSVINSRCAQCGNPHVEEEKRLKKLFSELYK